jgi:hypothetical protein
MLNGSFEVPIGAEREIRDLVAIRIRVIDAVAQRAPAHFDSILPLGLSPVRPHLVPMVPQ